MLRTFIIYFLSLTAGAIGFAPAGYAQTKDEMIQQQLRELKRPTAILLNDTKLGIFVSKLRDLRGHLNDGSPFALLIDEHFSVIESADNYYQTHTYYASPLTIDEFRSHVSLLFAGLRELFPNGYTIPDIVKNNTPSLAEIRTIRSALENLRIPRRVPTLPELNAFADRLGALIVLVPENSKLGGLLAPRIQQVEAAKKGSKRFELRFENQMFSFRKSLRQIFGGYFEMATIQQSVQLRGHTCQADLSSTPISDSSETAP